MEGWIETAVELFQQAVKDVGLSVLAGMAVLALAAWLGRMGVFGIARRMLCSAKGAALGLVLSGIAIWAGTKPNLCLNPQMLSSGGEAEATNAAARVIVPAQVEAGFALARVGTNETWDFSTPAGANVHGPWRMRGANQDRFALGSRADAPWAFPLGTNIFDGLLVSSSGSLAPKFAGERFVPRARRAAATSAALQPEITGVSPVETNLVAFFPFRANLGAVPGLNWPAVGEPGARSLFWWQLTSSNSLVLTWKDFLLDRDPSAPVSFQAEFFWNGDFVYRYDLSRCGGRGATALPGATVGAFNGGLGECAEPTTNLTSVLFSRVVPEDFGDRDGDGISSADEIFIHGTDPGLPDTDGDGVPDGAETASGTDPLARDVSDADILARVGASATNESFLAANVVATNSLAAWTLLDGFAAGWTPGATNVLWERSFALARTSAWQQYFVSASPSNAAPWRLEGLRLEWEINGGRGETALPCGGAVAASPVGDSWRLPLSTNDFPATLTLRLRATGASAVRCPAPLHLAAYAPEFRIGGGQDIVGRSGARFHVFTKGSESVIRLSIDHSRRPHRAPPGLDECDMAQLGDFYMASGGLSFVGDQSGGTLAADRPGIYDLPDISLGSAGTTGGGTVVVLDPSARWSCEAYGCDGYDGLGYDWEGGWYYEEEYYPLDSRCLRRSWQTSPDSGVSYDNCELVVTGGCGENTVVTTLADEESASVSVDGVQVWSKRPKHVHDHETCGNAYREDFLGDGCDDCATDCANGNCDSLEGPTLGSLKFRIPLGAFAKGYVAGFAWFSADGPVSVSSSAFRLTTHPDANVTEATQGGTRRIASRESRGRDLRIEDIADGARVTIYDTAAQTLEHTWEIVNVGGDPSRVRFRKISRLGNVMSDETFAYDYDCGDWTRFDNVAQVGTRQYSSDDFADYGDGTKIETRTTTDASGNTLGHVTTEQTRIGECDNAVMRETYREELTGNGWKWSRADYWNDPQNHSRHGKPRLVQGNARAWTYTDYDEDGRETLRVEQRGDASVPSEFPHVVSNELLNASVLDNAFVTVKDYEPPAGDSSHDDDSARPRVETRYVVTNGVAAVIGRTWTRCTRLNRDGYAAIKRETWRTSTQDATPDFSTFQPSNLSTSIAYSYEITYAYTGADTPFLMRGAVAESLAEDGTLTVSSYSLSGGVLACETRRYGPETRDGRREMETFETMDRDAAYGTVLRRTTRLTDGGTVIADERSIYDSQNRLRSTTYLDGTSLTNAYSCCRLLWTRDREGRKVLRSAQTGTDHLYNATEETWIADVTNHEPLATNHAFRVTQHFYDALGRETNTVVGVANAPGVASDPTFQLSNFSTFNSISYPYGGSNYAVRTDERGGETTATTSYGDGYEERNVYTATNGTDVLITTTRTYHGGGSSIRREWPVGSRVPRDLNSGIAPQIAWTEERRFTDYAPDGYRVDYVVTTASDHPAVTNSISTYDLLGRLVTTAVPAGGSGTPWLVTSNAYDGATSRILTSTRYAPTLLPRTTTYLYNDWGEQVGTVLDGITNRTDTTYEQFSNEWWKVETSTVIGPSTNSISSTRTQLTGLSDSCRRHTVELVGRSHRDRRTDSLTTYDPATGIETETVTSSTGPTIIRRSLHGVLLSTETSGETTYNTYDAFARVVATSRTGYQPVQEGTPIGEAALSPLQSYTYSPAGDLLITHTYTNATDYTTETYAYDMLGNRIATTDAHGNTTYRTYDPLGRVHAEYGATYPVRYTYDTAGRRTSLSTTRDGTTWDTTTWTYDPPTGNCLSKTYADGSTVLYTYTPDNLLLRTTYASGKCRENVYDERRQIVAVEYSDGEIASFDYDAFLNEIAFSNDVAFASLDRDVKGNCTNDMAVVGEEVKTTRRTFDAFSRLTGIDGTIYDYNADGLLASISNDIALVEYAYTPDRLDAGYSLTLSNGVLFSRRLLRDGFRRSLVTNISSVTNGVDVGSLAYTYDALSRPTMRNNDTFGYNARSEVTAANIFGVPSTYGYDEIGNSTNWLANSLNQYSQFVYDLDGNMTQCGDWAYTYDAANRLKTISSNGVLLVTNFYDAKSRRVKKVTPEATTTFFYDGWNLIEERIAYANGTASTIRYYWGKDLSGTLQGAGGVGGLLYLMVDSAVYVPFYDHNGNITRYLDANGNTVAQYTYDAFGKIIAQSGSLADFFRHRFSTKYYDAETGLYYYGYRFYHPDLMHWLNRDPIGESGGANLYCFVQNASTFAYDAFGQRRSNLPGIILDALCEDAYNFAKQHFLHTPQELRAWDRYTNHGWRGRNRDIELSAAEVKSIAESISAVVSHVQARRGACKKGVSFSESKPIGGAAPSPWRKALGGVSVHVTTSCSNGCFSYVYDINDLYDFDIKGFNTSRTAEGEFGTIMVNLTQSCLQCDWQTFYHKGTYNGK